MGLRPGVDGILDAFQTHPLVAFGEHHALAQEGDFYLDLIGDPRFAATVGNVVVEFGSAAHQGTLDRYLAGEEVPYHELRRVWTDVVGFYPAVAWITYANFFAHVRLANETLPQDKKIKVWLGDPYLDWSTIKTREDIKPYQANRDRFAADLIERQILGNGRKALVIYGYPHFQDFLLRHTGVAPFETVWSLVRARHPDAFFVVRTHVGLPDKACSDRLEARLRDWKPGTLATPVKGTWLGDAMYSPECPGLPNVLMPPGVTKPVWSPDVLAGMRKAVREAQLDGILYLGPAAGLTRSPAIPDSSLDPDYVRDLERRSLLLAGAPFDARAWVASQARGSTRYDPGWYVPGF